MNGANFKAVIRLSRGEKEVARLKRLALLFDEVHFVRPLMAALSDEAAQRPASQGNATGSVPLNPLRDVSHDYQLLSVGKELEETLEALTEAGVAIDISDDVTKAENDPLYRKWRDPLIVQAAGDQRWKQLTRTPEDAYDNPEIAKVELQSMDSDEKMSFLFFREPPSIWCADVIASTGHLAQTLNAFPLLTEEFRPLLSYRYQLYMESLSLLRADDVGLPGLVGNRAGFAQAAFLIGNEVFSSDSISERSIEEILRYRSEMDISRRRFLSNDLMELASLIEENPWEAAAEEEVTKYVRGKLTSDAATFDAESVTTWEKLYGALASRAASVGQAAGAGGGIGGLTGQLLPHASLWEMMVGGTLLGLSKELPGVAKDVAGAVLESREQKRTGIAYLANFNDLP